jgi:3-phytase
MRKIMMCVATALAAACSTTPAVQAVRETAAVSATGDAADDPAIWVAPDPAQSLVIGTQKQGGLYVFDLNGAIVQEAPGGRPNNVDIREGFPWAEGASPIVAASDRTDNSIVIWRFNAETRRLEEAPRGRIATGFAEVYGFCLGRMGADYVALVTDRDSGDIGVWRITQTADGVIGGERISTYSVGSIAEGCVFDDEAGVYYLAQETVGVWRAATADASGESKRLIDTVGRGGNLVADVEGLSLWRGQSGAGYLVASVQGSSRYAVYNRGDNAYRGAFRIAASADASADAVHGTDGIDVVSAPLGSDFPQGLLVAQDDANTAPRDLQNFKYVSWADVAATLALD